MVCKASNAEYQMLRTQCQWSTVVVSVVCTGLIADFALAVGKIRFKVRLTTMGLPRVGFSTLGFGGFFTGFMASFMT
jgi:hypothetical protein